MNYKDVATSILAAIGGKGNVVSVMTCLTRLRLTLTDPSAVDAGWPSRHSGRTGHHDTRHLRH